MKVFETELPGVGRRYTLQFPTGGEFIVVLHNNGRRETYWREDAGGDSEALVEVTEQQDRRINEIIDGTYFQPVTEGLDDAFENARIKWIEVGEHSPIRNTRIREMNLRSRTGLSILAIQRGDETISNPDPDEEIQAGDTLVVVGAEDFHKAISELLDN